MNAMSALDQVRFEEGYVLQVSTYGALPSYHQAAGGIMNIYEDDGPVPSELYSNLSIDSSNAVHVTAQDQSGIAGQALYCT